ncbi:hypothetical protein EVAR_91947_1 [Eumeta japonica]|uniref:Uncharacterized protein n=1 Tax=Eumeta variegata TaxID=151549 RepID=A0A4C1SA48_EUMVA|nr:hypothetical protein EVAR_91947_1 [Eumeta japonica]
MLMTKFKALVGKDERENTPIVERYGKIMNILKTKSRKLKLMAEGYSECSNNSQPSCVRSLDNVPPSYEVLVESLALFFA